WDIYSLGCAFYQFLSGSVPFPKENAKLKFLAHLHQPPVDPRTFNTAVPYGIASLVLAMLEKDPAIRIRS
ncbi:MAG TPA: serine/threonine protein kinase, partial [Planctomycetaceae bacterium]|nr:serine/threonine protein kinase [Planctomycetaceae bacterium]